MFTMCRAVLSCGVALAYIICSCLLQKDMTRAITDSKASAGGVPGARDTSDIALVARLVNISSATSPHERQVPCAPDAFGSIWYGSAVDAIGPDASATAATSYAMGPCRSS